MKNFIFTICIGFNIFIAHAQKTNWVRQPFNDKLFVQNKGQFSLVKSTTHAPILYGCNNVSHEYYLTTKSFICAFTKKTFKPMEKEKEGEKDLEEEKREMLERIKIQKDFIELEFLGSNPNTLVEAENASLAYYNYDNGITHANGYHKIVYRNIYNNIDIEVFFHDQQGIKYNILAHAGSNINDIKIKYHNVKQLKLDSNKNLQAKNKFAEILDHQPISYYANNENEKIESSFELNNDVVSFNLVNPIVSKEIVIDPWITVPTLPNGDAYDIRKDTAGNVYIQGVQGIQKYSGSGSLLWTYNFTDDYTYVGDIEVDKVGNVYRTNGCCNGTREKLDALGNVIWSVSGGYEQWRLSFDPCKNYLFVGGVGLSGGGNLAKLDVNTGALSNGVTAGFETRAITADIDANLYSMHLGNITRMSPVPAIISNVPDGYGTFTEAGENYISGGFIGYNGIIVGFNDVYLSDGVTLNKRSKAALGTVSATGTLPGGSSHMCSGIGVDRCDNVYAGSMNGIYKFDTNFSPITSVTTPGAVYDLLFHKQGVVYACGAGFVGSFDLGGCNSIYTPYTVSSTTVASCNGQNSGSISLTLSDGLPTYYFNWSTTPAQTTPSITSLAPGSYTCNIVDRYCYETNYVFNVPSLPNPIPNFTVNSGCQNDLVQFTSTSTNSDGSAGTFTYHWDLSTTTSTLQNPTNTYTLAGVKSISLSVIDANGCKDSITKPITIYTVPTPTFIADSACFNSASHLLDASNGNGNTITNYAWDFNNDGTVDNTTSNPSHVFTQTGNNVVNYTVTTTPVAGLTCSSDTTQNVWVRTLPVADFNVTSVCQNSTTTFTDITPNTAGSITAWQWDFTNDGTIDNSTQNPTNVFTSSGNYTTSLIVATTNGCKDTIKKQVVVYGHAIPNFISNNVCYSAANSFTNNTSITIQANTGTVSTWLWAFGDNATSNLQTPNHTYSTPSNSATNTTYSVQLTVTTSNGCKDSLTKPITIYSLPTANFLADSVCFNSPSHLLDASNGNGNPITSYAWDFTNDNLADVTGPNAINYTMPMVGNNTVNYTVTSTPTVGLSCKTATTINVYTFTNPVASFNFVNKCINAQSNTFDASASNTNVGTIVDYSWNFGDGQTDNSPLPTTTNHYNLATLYNVTLTVTTNKGCTNSITQQVEVYEKPLLNITSQPNVCIGSPTTFTAQTLPNSGNVIAWFWDVNNTLNSIETNGQQSSYTFGTEGWQILNLIASTDKGCKDTLTRNVYINYLPKPEFIVDKPKGCPLPHCVTFTDQTPAITGPAQIKNWSWNFGNGASTSSATGSNQSTCYTNSSSNQLALFTVTLTSKTDSGCVASNIKPNFITVYPTPIANYTIVPDFGNVVVPLVHFDNQSVDYTKWYWTFGDGPKIDSVNVNPAHTYSTTEANSYHSQLIVVNQYGCKDTTQLLVDIAPDFVFYIPNSFTPNGDNINDGFIGVGIGIEKYEMWIYERWGTNVYYTDDITKPWNGKMIGKSDEAPQDVYSWRVEIKDVFGKKHNYVGHVTLLR